MDKQQEFKLSKVESIFVRGPLSRFKELLFITDSVEDLIKHIEAYSVKQFGLGRKQYKPKWWFSENKFNS